MVQKKYYVCMTENNKEISKMIITTGESGSSEDKIYEADPDTTGQKNKQVHNYSRKHQYSLFINQ